MRASAIKTDKKNILRIEGATKQILVAKGFKSDKDLKTEIKPYLESIKKLYDKFGFNIELIDYEQPFFADEIIVSSQLNNLDYDLFFAVEINSIIESKEKYLLFNLLKDRFNLTFLEDIVSSNPVYMKDHYYSDKINNMVSWKLADNFKDEIFEKFEEICSTMWKDKPIPKNRELSNMFKVKSNIPPYIDEILANLNPENPEENKIFILSSELQHMQIMSQKFLYEIGYNKRSDKEIIKNLIGDIIEDFVPDELIEVLENDEKEAFSQLLDRLPNLYKKMILMELLDRNPKVRSEIYTEIVEFKNLEEIINLEIDMMFKFLTHILKSKAFEFILEEDTNDTKSKSEIN